MKLHQKVIGSVAAVFLLVSCTSNVTHQETKTKTLTQEEYQKAKQNGEEIKGRDGKAGKNGFFRGGDGEDGESITITK